VRSATYENAVFLPEIFSIQNKLSEELQLNPEERRSLKYNMLNRLFSEMLIQKINISRKIRAKCLDLINQVSPGIWVAAAKTIAVIMLRKFRQKGKFA
jgi:hypothetical protein